MRGERTRRGRRNLPLPWERVKRGGLGWEGVTRRVGVGWWGGRKTGGSGTRPYEGFGWGPRGGSRRFFEVAQHARVGTSSGRGRFETGPYARGDARRAEDGRVGDAAPTKIGVGPATGAGPRLRAAWATCRSLGHTTQPGPHVAWATWLSTHG